MTQGTEASSGIAIVGMSCRLPGANGPEAFWQLLSSGRDMVAELPSDRWDLEGFYSEDRSAPGKSVSKWGACLEGIDRFDNRFFEISAAEARAMDPQQRLLLEEAWHCLEDAGIHPQRLREAMTSVYVGVMTNDYQQLASAETEVDHYACLGSYSSLLANRISHKLGLRGESLAIDTACSASLAALHSACRALRLGECDFALVAGANLILHPFKTLSFSKAGMLSRDGRCKTFDLSADGYVAGEGICLVLLEPLDSALAQGRRIHGVIRSSAVNHGGATPHVSAPTVEAQERLIRTALKRAALDPHRVSYVEAHGTGTTLGDPIEWEALTRAYSAGTDERGYCGIGSLKTQLGHLEAASGLAGLLKLLLMMRHGLIPPLLHLKEVNPLLAFERSPFFPVREPRDWPEPRVAAVSSFGFGGLNAHVIVEQAQEPVRRTGLRRAERFPFVLAARSKASLAALLQAWRSYVESPGFAVADPQDLAGTLCQRETGFEERMGTCFANKAELRDWLLDSSREARSGAKGSAVAATGRKEGWTLRLDWPDRQDGREGAALPFAPDLEHLLAPDYEEVLAVAERLSATCADSRDFAIHFALGRLLLRLVGQPTRIEGCGSGFWAGLVLAGALPLDAGLAASLGRLDGLALEPPRLVVASPCVEVLPTAEVLDPAALRRAADALELGPESAAMARLALQLLRAQHSFQNLLAEWSRALAAVGLDLHELLSELAAADLEAGSDGFASTDAAKLAAIAALACLLELHSRWDLTTRFPDQSPALCEWAFLAADRVLEPDQLTALWTAADSERPDLAALLRTRCRRMRRELPLLRDWQRNRLRREAPLWRADGRFVDLNGPGFSLLRDLSGQTQELASCLIPALMRLWLGGAPVAWQLFPLSFRPIDLPLYPFDCQSFWLSRRESRGRTRDQKPLVSTHAREQVPELPTALPRLAAEPRPALGVPALHRVAWIPWSESPAAEAAFELWIALEGAEHPLPNQLPSSAIFVHHASVFSCSGQVFALDLRAPDSFERLFASLSARISMLKGQTLVFRILTADEPGFAFDQADATAELHARTTAPLSRLARELIRLGRGLRPSLILMTRGLSAVKRGEQPSGFANGVLLGLLQTLAAELSQASICHLDLEAGAPWPRVFEPGTAGLSRVLRVAKRGDELMQRVYRESLPGPDFRFRKHGVYLISGGVGALGLALAEHLAGACEASLVLLGRSPLDPQREAALHRLHERGADLIYLRGDVSDAKRLAEMLAEARAEFGPLNGVIHCAGCVQPSPLLLKTDLEFVSTLGPKTAGLWNLHHLTLSDPLDFFCVFSSLTAQHPFAGLGDYAAANGFASSFCDWRAASSAPGKTLCLEYGLWREGGMGKDAATAAHWLKQGFPLLEREAGLLAWVQALASEGHAALVTDAAARFPEKDLEWREAAVETTQEVAGTKTLSRSPDANFERPTPNKSREIAIIGMAGRFPGAPDIPTFWRNLLANKESIHFFDEEELRAAGVPDWQLADPHYVRAMPLLADVDCFDAAFFRFSPKEAELMDPQQRLLLECAWHALEDAGYAPNALSGSTGVFLSVMYNLYLNPERWGIERHPKASDRFNALIASDKDFAATRIAYKLNLNGPALTVQTACSSALTAVHLACQSLLSGESELALAGGASLVLPQEAGYPYQPGFIHSPDGHCRPFDAQAGGTVFGNGVGVLVLKRLDQALQDRDPLYAVIKGSALNNDGATKADFTSPGAAGQQAVVERALEVAVVDPATIRMVEAHGTGTRIGDPIEVEALTRAYRRHTERRGYCALGSVKSNLGHLNTAAAVPALIKVALALREKRIPATLHYKSANPEIDFPASPFFVADRNLDWPGDGHPARGAVSSFGIGGTNVHAILEEAPPLLPREQEPKAHDLYLLPFSARRPEALAELWPRFLTWLEEIPESHRAWLLPDLAYTLLVGRAAMSCRALLRVGGLAELRECLLELSKPGSPFLSTPALRPALFGVADLRRNPARLTAADSAHSNALAEELRSCRQPDRLKVLLHEAGDAFLAGLPCTWRDPLAALGARRIHLPLYPFAKTRFWFKPQPVLPLPALAPSPSPHKAEQLVSAPALERSAANPNCFTTRLQLGDFYLDQHRIGGEAVLPAAVQIELVLQACLHLDPHSTAQLESLTWLRPIWVSEPALELSIEILAERHQFRIFTASETGKIFSQGTLLLIPKIEAASHKPAPAFQAIPPFPLECPVELDPLADELYRRFRAAGISHGSSFQCLRKLHVSEKSAEAILVPPAPLPDSHHTSQHWFLHPGLLDSAFQLPGALLGSRDERPWLPFALQRIRIFAPLRQAARVVAHLTSQSPDLAGCDLQIFSPDGELLLDCSGFRMRPWTLSPSPSASLEAPANQLFFAQEWQRHELPVTPPAQLEAPTRPLLWIGTPENYEAIAPQLRLLHFSPRLLAIDQLETTTPGQLADRLGFLSSESGPVLFESAWFADSHALIAERATMLFDLLRALQRIRLRRGDKLRIYLAAIRASHRPLPGALPGLEAFEALFRTLEAEHSGWSCRCLAADSPQRLALALLHEFHEPRWNGALFFAEEGLWTHRPRSLPRSVAPQELPIESGGVVPISGGLGGLGLIFAREIARRGGIPLLFNRTPPDSSLAQHIADFGAQFFQADVTRAEDLRHMLQYARTLGPLRGLIHAAGLLRDGLLWNKSHQDLQAVLEVKLNGVTLLDQLTAEDPLAFFICFSSIAGVLGNPGQSDYSLANGYLNGFAQLRESERAAARRQGRTLAVAWPLWHDGGMKTDPKTEARLAAQFGMTCLDAASGWLAFEFAWQLERPVVALLAGDIARLRSAIEPDTVPLDPSSRLERSGIAAQPASTHRLRDLPTLPSSPAPDPAPLPSAATAPVSVPSVLPDLIAIVSQILKIEPADIDPEEEFSNFGFDSISFIDFAERINLRFHTTLTPPEFFEHPTLSAFSSYLAAQYLTEIRAFFVQHEPDRPSIQPPAIQSAWPPPSPSFPTSPNSSNTSDVQQPHSPPAEQLHELVSLRLSELASTLLKVEPHEFDLSEDLRELGFDSISLSEFAAQISQEFGIELSPAEFFEHPNLKAFVSYLLQTHREPLASHFNAQSSSSRLPNLPNPDALQTIATPSPAQSHSPAEPSPSLPFSTVAASERSISGLPISGRPDFNQPRSAVPAQEPIAIVGMAAILPQSPDLTSFWRHLVANQDLICTVPESRWDWRTLSGNPSEPNKTHAKWGGFIQDVEAFDAAFFGISPKEARLMDPQQRLVLETAWAAIEDSGHRPSELAGSRTAVFIGVATGDYLERLRDAGEPIEAHTTSGLSHAVLANRISYFFNLKGPSLALDTACSSSLIAINRGIEAIRHGHCQAALAGGVNLILSPTATLSFSKAGMLSPDGRCKTFDRRADGYVRGEGVGLVLLKPLSAALADRDPIHALLIGHAENHGGRTSSLTAPSISAQAELLLDAYTRAGIDPRSLGFIEAHGTGTALGDPIEVQALRQAFAELYRRHGLPAPQRPHIGLGSIKTQIGHLETAAGVAGLLKVLLAMRHRTLPANLHFQDLNPYIKLEGSPFRIQNETTAWQPALDEQGQPMPLRAGISSFGFGGVNAHLVIESPPDRLDHPPTSVSSVLADSLIFPLSAKSAPQLLAQAASMLAFIRSEGAHACPLDLAYTLQLGREPMAWRLALTARSLDELALGFECFLANASNGTTSSPHAPYFTATPLPERKSDSQLLSGREGQAFFAVLFQDRKWSKLAALWADGYDFDWSPLYTGKTPRRLSLPTYPFARTRFWIPTPSDQRQHPGALPDATPPAQPHLPEPCATDPITRSPAEQVTHSSQTPSLSEVTAFLATTLAEITGLDPAKLDYHQALSELGLDSIFIMKLIELIEQRFQLRLFAHELASHPSLAQLAEYLANELLASTSTPTLPGAAPLSAQNHGMPPSLPLPLPPSALPAVRATRALAAQTTASKELPLIFLLSTPRAGSTLFRVMLMGHPSLYAPPELHLLPFANLAERRHLLEQSNQSYLGEGFVETLAQLEGLQPDAALHRTAQLEAEALDTPAAYQHLRTLVGRRFLIDKSPSYAMNPAILARAETLSPPPFYIFLTRHPLSVMSSFVKNRFDKMLGISGDPWLFSEQLWYSYNTHIRDHLAALPPERSIHIRYEELVTEPESVLRPLCHALGLEFDPAMLQPYQGSRMTDGLHAHSLAIGDPNFKKHDRIDPELAKAWEKYADKLELIRPETRTLAHQLGYPLPAPNPFEGSGPIPICLSNANQLRPEVDRPNLPMPLLMPTQAAFLRGPEPMPWWIYHLQLREGSLPSPQQLLAQLDNWIGRHPILANRFRFSPQGWSVARGPLRACEDSVHVFPRIQDPNPLGAGLGLAEQLAQHLDPTDGRLLALGVAPLSSDSYLWLLVGHHLVLDGFSLGLLLREAETIGSHAELIPECGGDQYASEWATFATSPQARAQFAWWKAQLTEGFTLPVQAHNRALHSEASQGQSGESECTLIATFQLSPAHLQHSSGTKMEGGLFEHLATSLYLALARWTQRHQVVISHRFHHRTAPGFSNYANAVGWFADDFPLPLQVPEGLAFPQLLQNFTLAYRQASTQAAGFSLHEKAGALPSLQNWTQVRLNYQPQFRQDPQRQATGNRRPREAREYPLEILIRPHGQSAEIHIRYDQNQLNATTVQALLTLWQSSSGF